MEENKENKQQEEIKEETKTVENKTEEVKDDNTTSLWRVCRGIVCKFCSNGTPILKSAVHSF